MKCKVFIFFSLVMTSLTAYSAGCTSDNECKGERICEANQCVSPNGSSGGTAKNKDGGAADNSSSTCKFTNGPKAGQTQHWPRGTPGLTPTQIGLPCHDGMGSYGVAIQDE